MKSKFYVYNQQLTERVTGEALMASIPHSIKLSS
jgi:hypothetical protein